MLTRKGPQGIVKKLFTSAVLVLALMFSATPAYSESPPTALALAKKLVKAKVCYGARISDPDETTAVCFTAVRGSRITLHAFRNAKAMRTALNADLADGCEFLESAPVGNDRQLYRVGTTWFMRLDPTVEGIRQALGGKLRLYDCP